MTTPVRFYPLSDGSVVVIHESAFIDDAKHPESYATRITCLSSSTKPLRLTSRDDGIITRAATSAVRVDGGVTSEQHLRTSRVGTGPNAYH